MPTEIIVKYLLAFAIIFDASIAWFVLLKNPRKPVNQAYFFMVLWITVWQVSNFVWSYYPVDLISKTLLHNISFAALAGLVAAALYFVITFPNKEYHQGRFFLLIFGFSVFFMMISLVNYSEPLEESWFFPLYFMYCVLTLAITICIGIYRWFMSDNTRIREQFQYLLLGFSVPAVFASFTTVFLPLTYLWNDDAAQINTAINNFGVSSTVFFSATMAYAILRHRLLRMKVVMPRQTIVKVVVSCLLLGVLMILPFYIPKFRDNLTVFILLGFGLFVVALKPLTSMLDKLLKRIVKPELIDLYKLSQDDLAMLAKSESPEKLARMVAHDFYRHIPVEHFTFIYNDVFSNCFRVLYPLGQKQLLAYGEAWSQVLVKDPSIFSFDKIESKEWDAKEKRSMQNFCRKFKAVNIIPLKYDVHLLGILLLGEKIRKEPLKPRQKQFMKLMQRTIAITLKDVLFLHSIVRKGMEDGVTLAMLEKRKQENQGNEQ